MHRGNAVLSALQQLIQAYRRGDIGSTAEESRATLQTIVDLLERPNGPLGILSNQGIGDRPASPNHATEQLDLVEHSRESSGSLATEFHHLTGGNRSGGKISNLAHSAERSSRSPERSASANDSSPQSASALIHGTMHHSLVQPHAEGGLGAVFLAIDESLQRAVALKEIKSKFASDSRSREQFLLEAQITARLSHPGIVPVYAIGAYPNGRPYYTMRFIQGLTLLDAIRHLHQRRSSIAVADWQTELKHLIRRFVAACHAISYAHHEGYLHRDIKPQNIMLGEYGEALVVDWGLAIRIPKRASDDKKANASSQSAAVAETHFHMPPIETPIVDKSVVGTPAYMSPEQTLGNLREMDERSDIFSLGCTLYEISTGEIAFGGTTRQEVTDKILAGNFSEPRSINPCIPKPLAAICIKAIAFGKVDRYGSVNEFIADLEMWLDDEPPSVYQPSFVERMTRSLKRHRSLAISSSVVAATIFVATLVALVLVSREQSRTLLALDRESQAREQTLAALDTVTDETISQTLARQTELSDADKQFFQNILVQYEKLLSNTSRVETSETHDNYQRARGLQRVGTLRRQLSLLEESETELRQSIELFCQMDVDKPNVCEGIAKARFELGLLLASTQKLEAAADQYDLAAKQYEKLHLMSRDDDHLVYAALARNNYGNAMWLLNRKQEARAAYEDSLAALPVSMARKSTYLRQKRALLLNNYAGTLKSDPETLKDSMAIYEEAASLVNQGLGDATLPSDQMAIAATLTNLATVYGKVGKLNEATEQLHRSIQLQQPVVDRFPGYSTYQQQFAKTQLQLGLIMAALKQPTAMEQMESAQRSLKALADRFPEKLSYQVDLADAIEMQTRSQFRLDSNVAKAKLEEALSIRKSLVDSHQSDVVYIRGLLATRIRYANELRTLKLYSDAVQEYEQIIATLEDPELISTGLSDGKARNRALFGIADSLSQLGNYAEALGYWEKLLNFEDDPDRVNFAMQRILCLMRLSRIDEGLQHIDLLQKDLERKSVKYEPVQHYDLACCYCVAAENAGDILQKAKLLDMAMKKMTLAFELGFFKEPKMLEHARKDADLLSIREYSEAKSLLIQIGILEEN